MSDRRIIVTDSRHRAIQWIKDQGWRPHQCYVVSVIEEAWAYCAALSFAHEDIVWMVSNPTPEMEKITRYVRGRICYHKGDPSLVKTGYLGPSHVTVQSVIDTYDHPRAWGWGHVPTQVPVDTQPPTV